MAKKATKKQTRRKSDRIHAGSGSSNPDLKPPIKQFIQSPNRSSRNGAAINMVVMHCTEASLASTLNTFKDGSPNGRQVSAHYVIDRNGDIYQMVLDGERANHCKGANSNSIGIEHVATKSQALTQAQTALSAALLRWLLRQYDISGTRVFGHDFAPGYSGGGTSCPDVLFGSHSQQAVQAWVNANVLAQGKREAFVVPVAQPETGSKLIVSANSLNVRLTPSVRGAIVSSLHRGDVVDWVETSPDQYWARVQKAPLVGWSSRRFLATAPDLAAAPERPFEVILNIAATSAIARYNWPGRGVAPMGYIKGMALVYARVYCKMKEGDTVVTEMAKADGGNGAVDALAHYVRQFQEAGMDNESSGVATLRHLFVLMTGLGMRESSGRYCEGRDRAASNTSADTAEAGLFQTSFDARRAHPYLVTLFQKYQEEYVANAGIGYVEIFQEGVTCRPRDWQNFGNGSGTDFQELSKRCPAFAAEFCALGLRKIRAHWGPINHRAAELRPECNQMLVRVEQAVDDENLCPV